jgi:hypothetical protein
MEVLNNFSVGVEFVLSNSSNYTNTSHTEYEYHALSEPPLEELIPVSIIYGITLVLGMLGNILVIFSVTRYQQMLTVTNTFLLSLASADLLLVIICVPVKVSLNLVKAIIKIFIIMTIIITSYFSVKIVRDSLKLNLMCFYF